VSVNVTVPLVAMFFNTAIGEAPSMLPVVP